MPGAAGSAVRAKNAENFVPSAELSVSSSVAEIPAPPEFG